MHYTKFKLLLCAIACSLSFQSAHAEQYCHLGDCNIEPAPFVASASYSMGRGVGFRRGYTSLGLLWNRPYNDRVLAFVDLKAHVFNNGQPAANAGLGVRYLDQCRNVVYGSNIYYDYRQGYDQGAHQVGIGLEMLGQKWDVRCNGYYAFAGTSQKIHHILFTYPGEFFADYHERQLAASGLDAEAGYNFLQQNECSWFGLYAAAGPYYFHTRSPHDAWGGRIRFLATLGQYFRLELRTTYDRVFHGRVQGLITLSYPFGSCQTGNFCWSDNVLETVARQPVVRNDMIVFDRSYRWRANF